MGDVTVAHFLLRMGYGEPEPELSRVVGYYLPKMAWLEIPICKETGADSVSHSAPFTQNLSLDRLPSLPTGRAMKC